MKKFGLVFLGKAIRVVSSLVVVLLLSRTIGQDEFGKYSYAISIYAVFIPFIVFGLENFVVKYYKGRLPINLTPVIVANTLLALVAVVGFLFFSLEKIHLIGFALLAGTLVFSTFNYLLTAAQEHLLIARISVLVSVISLGLKVAILLFSAAVVQNLLLVYFLDFLTPVVLSAFVTKARFRLGRVDFAESYSVLKHSFPFFLSTAIVVLLNKTDQLMIPHILDYEELAKYSLGYRLYEGFFVLQVVFVSLYFPLLAKVGLQKTLSVVGIFAALWVAVILLVSVILVSVGSQLFTTLFGEEYEMSALILVFLSVSLLPAFWGNVISKVAALVEGGGKALAYNNFITLMANVLLNLALIPLWGIYGAVLATIFSQLMGSVIIWLFYDQFRLPMYEILKVSVSTTFRAIKSPMWAVADFRQANAILVPNRTNAEPEKEMLNK